MMTLRNFSSAAARDAVCRLLVVTFVCLLLFPFHYHIHHPDGAPVQHADHPEHAGGVHAHAPGGDLDHQLDGHIFKPAGEVSLKTPGGPLAWAILFAAFVLLLPFLAQARQPLPLPLMHRLPRPRRHGTPPLRAPPRA